MNDGWIDRNDSFCPACGHQDSHARSWWIPGDPLVTLIAFWPVEERGLAGYDNRWISRCHLRTACAHAHWSLQIVERPEQVQIPPGCPVVCLEEPYPIDDSDREDEEGERHQSGRLPAGDVIELQDFDHPVNATYIVGNTFYQRPSEHFAADFLVGISLDDPEIASYSPLYGDQLAALIWYDRKIKNARARLNQDL